MKIAAIIIILDLLTLPAAASYFGNWQIKGGSNYSVLVHEKNYELKLGYNFGIGKNIKLHKSLYIYYGVQYEKRNFILKDRVIIPVAVGYNKVDVYSWDVHLNVNFIDIPLYLKYNLISRNKFFISPIIGASLSIPYKDYSSVTKKSFQYSYDPPGYNIRFDNSFLQEMVFDANKMRIIINAGLELSWDYIIIDLRYCYDSSSEISIKNLNPFKGEMNIFRISVGLNL